MTNSLTTQKPPLTLTEAIAIHNAKHAPCLVDITHRLHTPAVAAAAAECTEATRHYRAVQDFVDAPTTGQWYKARLRRHAAHCREQAEDALRGLHGAVYLALRG